MTTRLLVAIPGVAIILLAVALGGPVFAAFALLVGIGALFEFYSLTAAFMPLREAGYATVVASVLLCLWVNPPERALILALALGLLFAALAALRLVNREEITLRVGMTLMGGFYIAFPIGVRVLTRELPAGAGATVNLLVGVWMFALQLAGFTAAPIAGHLSDKIGPRKIVMSSLGMTCVVLLAMAFADEFGLIYAFYFMAVTIIIANVFVFLTPAPKRAAQ